MRNGVVAAIDEINTIIAIVEGVIRDSITIAAKIQIGVVNDVIAERVVFAEKPNSISRSVDDVVDDGVVTRVDSHTLAPACIIVNRKSAHGHPVSTQGNRIGKISDDTRGIFILSKESDRFIGDDKSDIRPLIHKYGVPVTCVVNRILNLCIVIRP